ncbi:MAG: YihY/virulence factor BrkB family protein [Desulfobulbaceae bacterium]|nr:YihY/virulence factor BrkB family protein [Desulfobulbaceae bacterium]
MALGIIASLSSLRETLGSFWDSIREVPPPGPLSARDRFKAVVRVLLIVIGKFRSDDIPLRASALTFTVILSLVPLLALGTAVLKGFGAGDDLRQTAHRFIDQLDKQPEYEIALDHSPARTVTPQVAPSVSPAPPPTQGEIPRSLSSHLGQAVDQIFDYVDRTDFTTLGAFGVVGLLVSVVMVLSSIETAMNAVWQVNNDRSISRKVLDYLALMVLMPLSLNLALAVETALRSPALNNHLTDTLHLTWFGHQFLKIFPVVLVVLSFIILYRFLPNTRIGSWPALLGGLFAGSSWVMIQVFYLRLQVGVARYNTIYGSFATLPLFLLWLYLGWLIFLTGAVMSYAVQHWRYYLWEGRHPTPMARLALAFDIMGLIKEDFTRRMVTTQESLASRLRQPEARIASIVTDLLHGNILRKCIEPAPGYLPAAPSGVEERGEVIDAILGAASGENGGMKLVTRAVAAVKKELQ